MKHRQWFRAPKLAGLSGCTSWHGCSSRGWGAWVISLAHQLCVPGKLLLSVLLCWKEWQFGFFHGQGWRCCSSLPQNVPVFHCVSGGGFFQAARLLWIFEGEWGGEILGKMIQKFLRTSQNIYVLGFFPCPKMLGDETSSTHCRAGPCAWGAGRSPGPPATWLAQGLCPHCLWCQGSTSEQ